MGNNCSGTLVEKEKKLCRIGRCENGESELLSLGREQFGGGVLKGSSGTQIKWCKCSGINLNSIIDKCCLPLIYNVRREAMVSGR